MGALSGHDSRSKQKWNAMGKFIKASEEIDHRTLRSICEAVGKHLQQNCRPETGKLPRHLEYLMQELCRRDQARPLR